MKKSFLLVCTLLLLLSLFSQQRIQQQSFFGNHQEALKKINELRHYKESYLVNKIINYYDFEKMIFFGTEPFWSIIFEEKSAYLNFVDSDRSLMLYYSVVPDNYNLKNAIIPVSREEFSINTTNEQSEKIVFNIKEEKCSDGMSDKTYAFSVYVDFVDFERDNLSGCGRIMTAKQKLRRQKSIYEQQLFEIVERLLKDSQQREELKFTENIKDFKLYRDSENFRSLVDEIKEEGFKIKKRNGRYQIH